MNDPYAILGVTEDASDALVREAYKDAARRLHPDVPTGDEDKFKELQVAMREIADERAKKGGGIADLFTDATKLRRVGQNKALWHFISLEECFGLTPPVFTYSRTKPCPTCLGKGGKLDWCSVCGGTGYNTGGGALVVAMSCAHCKGRCQEIVEPCRTCNKFGVVSGQIEQLPLGRTLTEGDLRDGEIVFPGAGDYPDSIGLSHDGEYGSLIVLLTLSHSMGYFSGGKEKFILRWTKNDHASGRSPILKCYITYNYFRDWLLRDPIFIDHPTLGNNHEIKVPMKLSCSEFTAPKEGPFGSNLGFTLVSPRLDGYLSSEDRALVSKLSI